MYNKCNKYILIPHVSGIEFSTINIVISDSHAHMALIERIPPRLLFSIDLVGEVISPPVRMPSLRLHYSH